MQVFHKPGEIVPISGIYSELSISGVKQTEITCIKGEAFPNTKGQGYHYELLRGAKHRKSEG